MQKSLLLVASLVLVSGWPVFADVSNWIGPDPDFNNASNWDAGVPTDIAGFNNAEPQSISLSANASLNSLSFNSEASPYTITMQNGTVLSLNGEGVNNASANTQSLSNVAGQTVFNNSASAGNASIYNDGNLGQSGETVFNNTSTAGNASITNGEFNAGGHTTFNDSSSAGNATFSNAGFTNGVSHTTFNGSSSAANATISNSGTQAGIGWTEFRQNSTAAQAVISNSGSSRTDFFDSSTAGAATITNSASLSRSAVTNFTNTATAGEATITNSGNGGASGFTIFDNDASAGNATITNNNYGGTAFIGNSGAGSAAITNNTSSNFGSTFFSGSTGFANNSSAENATITNNGRGHTTFQDASTAGNATIVNNLAVPESGGVAGGTSFFDTSSAGSANVTNYGTLDFLNNTTAGSAEIFNDRGGVTDFSAASTAGQATITNTDGATLFSNNANAGSARINNVGGSTRFQDGASAASASIGNVRANTTFAGNSTAGSASLSNGTGGVVAFIDNATADQATLANNPGGGLITFLNTARAADATIDNSGGGVTFQDASSAGNAVITSNGPAQVLFTGSSNAGNSTLIANAISRIIFGGSASGGTATLVANEGGIVDISGLESSGLSVGSIAGSGSYTLGSKSLTAGNDQNTEVSGVISGQGGSLVKIGGATLTLLGANTYTGGTTVAAGTLQGNSTSLQGSILNNAAVIFDQAFDGTYAGAMRGTGSLTKIGNGLLTLSAAHAYTGDTAINAGTLNLTGSLAGRTTVGAGGTLTGLGSLTELVNSGNVTPGAGGAGTLRAASYSGPGALNITFNGTEHNALEVAGNANVSQGTLNLGGTNFTAGQYSVVHAGSVSGTFATVNEPDSAFLNFDERYTPTDVFVDISETGTSFASVAQTDNETSVATALDEVKTNSTDQMAGTIGAISQLSADQARAAYNQISGDALTYFQGLDLRNASLFTHQMNERAHPAGASVTASAREREPYVQLAYLGDYRDWDRDKTRTDWPKNGVWARGIGLFDHTDADSSVGSPSAKSTTGGVQGGYDHSIGEHGVLGVSAGYAKTTLQVDDRLSSGKSEATQGGLYAGYLPGSWFFNGSVGYTEADNEMTRGITFSGGDAQAQSDFKSRMYTGYIEAGYAFKPREVLSIEPSVSLEANHIDQDGFTETGAPGFNLTVDKQKLDSLVSAVGARIVRYFQRETTHPFLLGLRGAWLHEHRDINNRVSARFADVPAASFVVQGTPQERNAAAVGLDTRLKLYEALDMFANYTATLSSGKTDHGILGGLSWKW